jgi:hypothetical protein
MANIVRRIKNELRFAPFGRLHRFLVQSTWQSLLLWFSLVYFSLAFAFAALYSVLDGIYVAEGNATSPAVSFNDFLFYSIANQLTVDTVGLSPSDAVKPLSLLQAFLGTVLHAIGIGFVFAKASARSHGLQFAECARYDRETHQLEVRMLNRDINYLVDFDIKLGIEKPIPVSVDKQAASGNYRLVLSKAPTIVEPMQEIVTRTRKEPHQPDANFDPNAPPPLSLWSEENLVTMASQDEDGQNLWINATFFILLHAKVRETGADMFAAKHYGVRQIKCGTYRRPAMRGSQDAWQDLEWENFGKVDESSSEHCDSCACRTLCPLDPALKYWAARATANGSASAAEP